MSETDWAKIYAAMDKRIVVKYEQLPNGEQVGSGRRRKTSKQRIPEPMASGTDMNRRGYSTIAAVTSLNPFQQRPLYGATRHRR
jgi:hypothetical protein